MKMSLILVILLTGSVRAEDWTDCRYRIRLQVAGKPWANNYTERKTFRDAAIARDDLLDFLDHNYVRPEFPDGVIDIQFRSGDKWRTISRSHLAARRIGAMTR
jgi:hypothetical protein